MKQAAQNLFHLIPSYVLFAAPVLAIAAYAMGAALELLQRVQGG